MVLFLYLTLIAALPSAFLALACGFFSRSVFLLNLAGVAGTFLAGIFALVTAVNAFSNGPISAGDNLFYVDGLSALLLAVIALVSLIAITYSIPYMGRELLHGHITLRKLGWYYFWFNILVPAMYATVVFNSLGLTWVLVEATTLASAPLVGFYGRKQSLEAAWKYVVIATVGISFALLGILLTYVASVSNLPENSASLDWTFLLKNAASLDPGLMKLAFIFVLVGYGTKTGLAPMHTWLPDAHSQAPSPVSALMSGALLNCALYGILRFDALAKGALGPDFSSTLLLVFGLISIGIVIPFIVKQEDFKRLLAYSSVEHMGIIVLAVGLGGEIGAFAGALHLFNHAIAKSFMFCVAGEVTERYGTREMARIHGVVGKAPLLGTLLFCGVLAITGVPPFNVFVSEFLVITGAFVTNHFLVAGLFLACLAAIFASLIYHAVGMAFGTEGQESSHPEAPSVPVLETPALAYAGNLPPYAVESFPFPEVGQLISGSEPEQTRLQTAPPTALLEHREPEIEPAAQRLELADRVALFILLVPAATLLVLGLWIPGFMQDWFHLAGVILK